MLILFLFYFFISIFSEPDSAANEQTLCIIDSLSTLCLYHPVSGVASWLYSIQKEYPNTTFCALLHSISETTPNTPNNNNSNNNNNDSNLVSALSFVASSTIHLSRTISIDDSINSKTSIQSSGLAEVTHQRKTGKVLHTTEVYSIDSLNGSLSAQQYNPTAILGVPTKSKAVSRLSFVFYFIYRIQYIHYLFFHSFPFTKHQADPTANLTFNLTLSEQEKRARENVVLPYLKTATDKTAILKKDHPNAAVGIQQGGEASAGEVTIHGKPNTTGPRILFEPEPGDELDDNDDRRDSDDPDDDEEDPDDDLDI